MFEELGRGRRHGYKGQVPVVWCPVRVCCPRQRGRGEPGYVEGEGWAEFQVTFVESQILTGECKWLQPACLHLVEEWG